MTPVEERIDHEAIRKRAEAWAEEFARESPVGPVECDLMQATEDILALLTEHSAREEALRELLYESWRKTFKGETSRWYFDELLNRTLAALPATEPAQPEEEPNG